MVPAEAAVGAAAKAAATTRDMNFPAVSRQACEAVANSACADR
jgi:hypothetical protein